MELILFSFILRAEVSRSFEQEFKSSDEAE